MHRLDTFGVDDLVVLSKELRELGDAARPMASIAAELTTLLHTRLVDRHGQPACALVRLYKTHRFADLEPPLQAFARDLAREPITGDTRCLTLLGTAGLDPAWNDRTRSAGHQAIPLTSEAIVAQSPMIAQLIAALGLDVTAVVRPDPMLHIEMHHRAYNVFFVPEARGAASIPAQEFVARYGICSAVGVGGVLPSGDLFALVVFTVVPILEEVADLFRSLAPAVKAAIIPSTFHVFG